MSNISPYFEFGVTGIELDSRGLSKACYNLNDKYEITDNSFGIASYKDAYDENMNHIQFAYYNKNDKPTPSSSKLAFATGKKTYDNFGNVVKEAFYDINDGIIREIKYNYDDSGNFLN